MENSLTFQSRKLLEQLSHRRNFNFNNNSQKDYTENAKNIEHLLLSTNNLRPSRFQTSFNEHNISESYPKSSITSILSRSAFLSKSTPKRIPFGISNTFNQTNDLSINHKTLKNADLLGYDWIAGMMENKSKESQLDKPSEYFENLDKFRRMNKQFCISNDNRSNESTNNSYSKDYKNILNNYRDDTQQQILHEKSNKIFEEQPPVYAYTLNERLFPVPLDYETAERGIPDSNNPHIIKVSIPSNRFQKMHHKEKNHLTNQNSNVKNIGESLSLSSHCHSSTKVTMPVSHIDKSTKKMNSSRQEPAGLIGSLLQEVPISVSRVNENLLPFCKYQPKNEQEAIDQLKRGKTGAKLNRIVPSSLENRSFHLDFNEVPSNICQTRIVLKDMIENSFPRENKPFVANNSSTPDFAGHIQDVSDDVPRPSISRKEMNKVFGDEIQTIRDNVKSN